MKKALLLVLVVALCICVTSCGGFGKNANLEITIHFEEDLVENEYEFGLMEDFRISGNESFAKEFIPENSQIVEQKIIYSFRVDKLLIDADVVYVKAPSIHRIEGIEPVKIKLEEAVIKNSDGEEWFEITKAKEDVGSTDVAFISLNGDVPLNFQLLADGKSVPPYTFETELDEQGYLIGSMSFKKWPIDDDGARLSIKSSLSRLQLTEDDFYCEGKKIVIIP